MPHNMLIVRKLGLCDYLPVLQSMQAFTATRQTDSIDEMWLVQHPPVFTQGQAGKPEHILDAGDIPIVQTDRGGQVTYHGPGQSIIYCLFRLQALGLGIRGVVNGLENSVLAFLADHRIQAHRQDKAPGVYVDGKKICSIGLRLRRGFTYHGLALNINMDLTPFDRIHPCGYPHLKMTQVKDYLGKVDLDTVTEEVLFHLRKTFGYTDNPIIITTNHPHNKK